MQNFRTFDLAELFYRQSRALPVKGALRDQLHRAALSIARNLAEARGKPTKRDQVRFFHIAMGSLRECQALLGLEDLTNTEAWETLDQLGGALYRLIKNAR